MKVLLSFLFIGLLSSVSYAEVGFSNGNDVSIVYLSGSVTYLCPNYAGHPNNQAHYSCSGYLANPGTHDYFVTDKVLDANKVTLTATHADGSTRTKDAAFDANKSASSTRFNLITSTLFQRPLLNMGENKISYTITNGNQVTESGSFISHVTNSGNRTCAPRTLMAHTNDYCKNITLACDNYFETENNCQY